ncbi:hypothetical protein [Dasania marina]|uniref:hypothetical protein n=1 Tax=Dasania marina TaxID=471499 RepID=UPI0004784BCD|nr:hypothetical protein [Dasania marina]
MNSNPPKQSSKTTQLSNRNVLIDSAALNAKIDKKDEIFSLNRHIQNIQRNLNFIYSEKQKYISIVVSDRHSR